MNARILVIVLISMNILAPIAFPTLSYGDRGCRCIIHVADATVSLLSTFKIALYVRNLCTKKITVRDIGMLTLALETTDNTSRILEPPYYVDLPIEIEPGDSAVIVVNMQIPMEYIDLFTYRYRVTMSVITTIGSYRVVYISSDKYDIGPRFQASWRKYNTSLPLQILNARIVVSNNTVRELSLDLRSMTRIPIGIERIELNGKIIMQLSTTSFLDKISVLPYGERVVSLKDLNITYEPGREYVVKIYYSIASIPNCVAGKVNEVVFTT